MALLMHVDVHVQAVRQVRADHSAVLAGGEHIERGLLTDPAYDAADRDRIGELTLAERDSARERAGRCC